MGTRIRESVLADFERISACHLDAFCPQEGPEIVELVGALLKDPAAEPRLSPRCRVRPWTGGTHPVLGGAGSIA